MQEGHLIEPDSQLNLDEYILGASTGTLGFSSSPENLALARALSRQAQRSIAIYTRELEQRIYDDGELLKALRNTAVAHPQSRVRVLIRDSERAVKYGHRLIELARHLSTHIEVRRPHADCPTENEAFLIADDTGFFHRPLADRYEGEASFHDPKRARELLDAFEAMWARSAPDLEFRRLYI